MNVREVCKIARASIQRKVQSASQILLGGGIGIFSFVGYFLDRFFGFGVHCGLRIFHFLAFGFRFSRKKCQRVFGFDIRCGFRFFLFDLFAFRFLLDLSSNYAPPLISLNANVIEGNA